MVFSNNVVSLEELEVAITQSYPGIEQQLKETFIQHDIVGDGQLPYNVVEPLLRHFLVKCGLGDYMDNITDSDGRLMNERLSPYLVGTSIEGIADFDDEHMMTLQEMSTMAIVWLKIISDFYPKEDVDTSSAVIAPTLCCGAANVSDESQLNGVAGNVNEMEGSVQVGEETYTGPVYTEHVNDEIEEEEIRKKNMKNYIQTLVNETAMNRNKGVKCYVYSAATTANGACVSAGAAVPQRRPPRPRENKKPAAGCC